MRDQNNQVIQTHVLHPEGLDIKFQSQVLVVRGLLVCVVIDAVAVHIVPGGGIKISDKLLFKVKKN